MVFDHSEALGRPAIVSLIEKYGRFFYHMLAFCQFNFEALIAHKFYADSVFLPRVYECFSSAELLLWVTDDITGESILRQQSIPGNNETVSRGTTLMVPCRACNSDAECLTCRNFLM